MKTACLRALGIVLAGLALLAGCTGEQPSAQGTPSPPTESVGETPSSATPAAQTRPQLLSVCLVDATTIALINGVILTVDATDSQASSVLIEGSRISAVGDSITLPEGACVVDLGGRTVVPGFIDSHVHFTRDWLWPGYFLWQIEDARSTQDVLDGLRERVESVPAGEYIAVVGGYPTSAFGLPTLAELDAVAPDHPVYLQASFSGPAVVNSLAKADLEANGLATIAASGRIPVDNSSRTPRAIQILRSGQTNADAERAAMEYMSWANSMGITTVIDMSSTGDVEMAYQLWEGDDLTVRMRLRFGGLGTIALWLLLVPLTIGLAGARWRTRRA